LNQEKEQLVFLLWGNFAKEKGAHIDQKKHLVLKAAHPSPFAADKGFYGCRHFSKTNQYLIEHGLDPIDWLIKSSHD
jgi:uracil-DNA glycosylase